MTSDSLNISDGGIVEIDSEALRALGGRIQTTASQIENALVAVRGAQSVIGSSAFHAYVEMASLGALHGRLLQAQQDVLGLATSVATSADIYEAVELHAQIELAAAGGERAALMKKLEELYAAKPELREQVQAAYLAFVAESAMNAGNYPALHELGVGGVLPFLDVLATKLGIAQVPQGSSLSDRDKKVIVTPVKSETVSGAPANIQETLDRFPAGDEAQVKVETYVKADGTTEYMVYIQGTQDLGTGTREPWDMESNLELYGGTESVSYAAVEKALEQAGVKPGDTLNIAAYSQGGMIATWLTAQGKYNVPSVLLVGSPQVPIVGEDTLVTEITHVNDPVANFKGAGHAGSTGSDDSIVIEREAHEGDLLQVNPFGAHDFTEYQETARQAEESGDPRMDAYSQRMAEMGDGAEVTSTEYFSERAVRNSERPAE